MGQAASFRVYHGASIRLRRPALGAEAEATRAAGPPRKGLARAAGERRGGVDLGPGVPDTRTQPRTVECEAVRGGLPVALFRRGRGPPVDRDSLERATASDRLDATPRGA